MNSIAVEATRVLLAADTTRLDEVRVIGVDEHKVLPRGAGAP